MEVAPKGLFSAKTCFFFSINPLEYAKLHDVDKAISAEVQYARYLMAKWSTGRTPGIEERTSKWEQALSKPPQRPIKRKTTDSLFLLAIVTTLDSIKACAESVSGVLQVRLPEISSRVAACGLVKYMFVDNKNARVFSILISHNDIYSYDTSALTWFTFKALTYGAFTKHHRIVYAPRPLGYYVKKPKGSITNHL
ncbi:hypothetical protein DPMN_143616 [Dreissena polymorpha]|uniref:Uncharacterized protein n=1 Tax=Dreissena polymorpha TaxID=45954 RepID=A0A9D4GGJ3_DREPO|nr:hypothetical protein DPMN_143616 [Dreissena polymorpha]